jgi:hypothetical protein
LALGLLGGFADGLWDLFRFTFTEADAAFLVANNDKCGEAKALTTLNGFGDAVDRNEAICKFGGLVPITATAISWFSCHWANPLISAP